MKKIVIVALFMCASYGVMVASHENSQGCGGKRLCATMFEDTVSFKVFADADIFKGKLDIQAYKVRLVEQYKSHLRLNALHKKNKENSKLIKKHRACIPKRFYAEHTTLLEKEEALLKSFFKDKADLEKLALHSLGAEMKVRIDREFTEILPVLKLNQKYKKLEQIVQAR